MRGIVLSSSSLPRRPLFWWRETRTSTSTKLREKTRALLQRPRRRGLSSIRQLCSRFDAYCQRGQSTAPEGLQPRISLVSFVLCRGEHLDVQLSSPAPGLLHRLLPSVLQGLAPILKLGLNPASVKSSHRIFRYENQDPIPSETRRLTIAVVSS